VGSITGAYSVEWLDGSASKTLIGVSLAAESNTELGTALVQIFLSVCFCLASGFAGFKWPGPRPKFGRSGWCPDQRFQIEWLFVDLLC
jgi:hypothetical protein